MTLGRQLMLLGLIIVLGLFIGMFAFNISNTQTFLNNQLTISSQETANVLGLSLSTVLKDKNEDLIVAERMVASIWDAGYYKNINVYKLQQDEPIVKKHRDVELDEVPDWIIKFIDFKTQPQSSNIMSGWLQLGTIEVESNPGEAYKKIWNTFKSSLVLLGFIALIASTLGGTILYFILKPLRAITKQAYQICNQEFPILEPLPWTYDLRQVVVAMNKMSRKLKKIFEDNASQSEELRKQAFQNPVTKLGNRLYFDLQFSHLTKATEQETLGVLLLIELHKFKEYNDQWGYDAGDKLLKTTADALKEITSSVPNAILAHMGGANFACILPRKTLEEGEDIAKEICARFADFQSQGVVDTQNVGHVGICTFISTQKQSEILSQGDMALRTAQSQGPNNWHSLDEGTVSKIHSATNWSKFFKTIIGTKEIELQFQQYKIFDEPEFEHYEEFIRLKDASGKLMHAGLFMPMAERLNLTHELDKLVVLSICDLFKNPKNAKRKFNINLSPISLEDSEFADWLLNTFKKLGTQAQQVVIELPEYGVVNRLEEVKALYSELNQIGVETAIDHYGKNFTSFSYLQNIRLTYLKIDGSFIRNLDQSKENQFFISSLIKIAHSLDIKVIAESVETEEELAVLQHLHVDGVQGYLIGKPKELEV